MPRALGTAVSAACDAQGKRHAPALIFSCPSFAGIQVPSGGLGAMEPAVGELQLVPGATKEVPATDAVCCRAVLAAAAATSIITLALAVLVGKWLRARTGPCTRRLAQRCSHPAQWYPCDDPRVRGLSVQTCKTSRPGAQAHAVGWVGMRVGKVIPACFGFPQLGSPRKFSQPG